MGCKQGKQVQVQPVGAAEVRHDNINIRKTKSDVSEYDIDENTGLKVSKNKNKNKRTKSSKSTRSKDSLGSCLSLDERSSIPDSERGNSASSKNSADSGFGAEYRHVITEESDTNRVREVESNFVPNEALDLGITGVACPTRLSAKDKDRMEESMVLQSLREEGLIARPHAKSSGGTSFEIVAAEDSLLGEGFGMPRPPPRLAKLERRRKKKKQLTAEEIREKLEKAERRKKRKEQERLEKIQKLEKSKDSVNHALEKFMVSQEKKDKEVHEKIDNVADKRERRLQEIKEKMAKREAHAEMVRKRKEQAVLQGNTNPMTSEYPEDEQAQ
ncbi:nucleolar protein 58-like [Mizuhopecten yessoensis]|uniref:Stathmin-3 n=1 Tax=Mizuhopecten yessoensis TaxID=6573 RepID=A0A210R067_MIZYE|nr:nucleolar protein 58-like [Mizuhopecten yessoensis]OWF54400.1 Stathmin-3 [Mizuhopecten yessoensis]